jgi:predicted glutamine amidotransferase
MVAGSNPAGITIRIILLYKRKTQRGMSSASLGRPALNMRRPAVREQTTMCELFGVSSSEPVRVTYSLHAFAEHGGLLHPNKSGWGIIYHEGRDALLIKEAEPASDSPWVRFIETQPLTSTCVIAHVRYASVGAPNFANTHPFMRELGGRAHFFAHNGGLEDIWNRMPLQTTEYLPIGETDSEYAFCVLLGRLAALWRRANGPPAIPDRLEVVAKAAEAFRKLGTANFLYSDGDVLFAHAHKRRWDAGDGSFSQARPPGLSLATRKGLSISGLKVEAPENAANLLYVASVPLTGDGWTPLPEGTLLALRDGALVGRVDM